MPLGDDATRAPVPDGRAHPAHVALDPVAALDLLTAVVESTIDAVYVKDLDGRYLLFNRAASAFTGRSADEVLGRDDHALFPADEADAVMEGDRRVLEAGRPLTYEERVTGADGAVHVFLSTKGALRGADGALIGLVGVARDITESVRASEAIAAGEAELAEAQRLAHVGSWTYRSATDEYAWSDEMMRIFGLAPGDPAPSLEEQDRFFEPGAAAAWRQRLTLLLYTGEPIEGSAEITRDDGTVRQIVTHAEAIRDAAGAIVGIRATVADVTDLRLAEAALRQSEKRYGDLAARLPVGIYIARRSPDGDTAFDYVSPQAGRILGIDPDEALRDPGVVFRAVHPDDLASLARATREANATGAPFRWEGRFVVRGEVRVVRAAAEPEVLTDGALVRHGLFEDVTDRRRAEEELRASAELQRSVFDAIADGVVVQDLTGEIVTANPAARTILGLELDEITGLTSADPRWEATREDGSSLPGDEHPAMVTLRTGEPVRDFPMSLARADGRRIWLQVNSEALRGGAGTITGVVTSFSDVTLERELEARLRQSQRLEAVGQLAGGIAHDFNNLLAAVHGYAELAREALPEDSPAREDLDEALRAADRAAGLTRQLLAFSRRQALRPEVVDPADGRRRLRPDAPPSHRRAHRAHDVARAGPRPGAGWTRGSSSRSSSTSPSTPATRCPRAAACRSASRTRTIPPIGDDGSPVTPAGACVRIVVSDTGTGMDPETLARAFEPFFTTKGPGGGSGMGLATVYGVVQQSGGRIAVASTPGEGTTFTIDLPRVEQPVAPRAATADAGPAPSSTGTGTILLVEDEEAVRATTRRMLAGLGYAVLEAASGPEALDRATAAGAALDLLVTDIRMPGLQGPELARRVRELRPGLPGALHLRVRRRSARRDHRHARGGRPRQALRHRRPGPRGPGGARRVRLNPDRDVRSSRCGGGTLP